ncbi:MAG: hypothetical protein FJ398_09870, partial [Verrucomicrobia bacterium]|nr:hypothetical protein [Verrucomicrobiota bacterium]
PKAAWLRCSSVEDPGRIFSFVAPRHPAFGAKTGPRGIFGHALRKLVEHVCNLLRPEAATREIAIATQIASELPALRADSVRLTQALLNILINALQAIERRGQVTVQVEPRPAEQILAIHVRDTGPGLPSEKAGAIFDPYFTTKAEGSGLGLWIAQQIAAAHGGGIQAANAPEGGAVFTLRLPLHQQERSGG